MKLSQVTARVVRTSVNGKEKEKNEQYLIVHKNTENPEGIAMSNIAGLVDPENIISTKLMRGASILPGIEGKYFYYANGDAFIQKEDDPEDLDKMEFKYFIRSDSFDDAYKFVKNYLDNGGDGGSFNDYELKSLSKKNILDVFK